MQLLIKAFIAKYNLELNKTDTHIYSTDKNIETMCQADSECGIIPRFNFFICYVVLNLDLVCSKNTMTFSCSDSSRMDTMRGLIADIKVYGLN